MRAGRGLCGAAGSGGARPARAGPWGSPRLPPACGCARAPGAFPFVCTWVPYRCGGRVVSSAGPSTGAAPKDGDPPLITFLKNSSAARNNSVEGGPRRARAGRVCAAPWPVRSPRPRGPGRPKPLPASLPDHREHQGGPAREGALEEVPRGGHGDDHHQGGQVSSGGSRATGGGPAGGAAGIPRGSQRSPAGLRLGSNRSSLHSSGLSPAS